MQTGEYGWWAVLDSRELRGGPLGVERFGRRLVFWRDEHGAPVAQEDRCPHRGTKLSTGRVVEGTLECPFHGFRFDHDGACCRVPAHPDRKIPRAMRVARLPVREAHGFVWLWVDESTEPQQELPWFTELDGSWSVGGFESTWSAHFTRCVENQLDWAHLAFVHRKTIGRFASEAMEFEVDSGDVEGTDAGYVRSFQESRPEAGIEWREPNIWINRISPKMKIPLAFVPVDADTTKLYLRNWQKQVTVPGLAWLWQLLSGWLNRRILAEDQRVVEDQLPRIGDQRSGDRLVPSDQTIALYRKLRARRQAEQEGP